MYKSESTKGCKNPERLKGKSAVCTPEQIRECHGELKEHPCIRAKWLRHGTWSRIAR